MHAIKMRMLLAGVAAIVAVAWGAMPAQAQTAEQLLKERYVHFTGEKGIDGLRVASFDVPGRPYYQQVLIGAGDKHVPHAVLLHCNARTCTGKTVALGGVGATFESLQLVDLRGEPMAQLDDKTYSLYALDTTLQVANAPPNRRNLTNQQLAIVVTTAWTQGAGNDGVSRSHLTIVDVKTNAGATLFTDATLARAYTGAGMKQTFALVRSPEHTTLDVLATGERLVDNRSGCLPAQPKPYTLTLVNGRYEVCTAREWTSGCGSHP